MSFNWSMVGSTISGLTSALSAAGVSTASMPSILNAIGMSSNPNQSEELGLCSQMMVAMGNPVLVEALAVKLATERGIPASAASLAMTLTQPGVNIPQVVMEIEQLIKQGG